MVKHLVNFHGSPLTRRVGCHTLYTTPILLPLLLGEKEIPIHLLHPKGPRNIADDCYSRHREIPGEDGVQQVHVLFPIGFRSSRRYGLLRNIAF
jgi:hypothetical protein